MKNKRGYFFSLDALFALLIILGVVLFIKPSNDQISTQVNVQEDILTVLSTLKIGEIENSYAQTLISDGNITDLNKTVLEQIGEFYANNNDAGHILAQNIFDDLDLPNNIGLYFDSDEMARTGSLDFSNATKVNTARQIISGVQGGNGSVGYAAKAFLGSKSKVNYFYFGGYIGDGNISVKIPGDVRGVGSRVEGVFSTNFTLWINGVQAGTTFAPPEGVPFRFNLDTYDNLIQPTNNEITFKSATDENLYIAGGYIKIVYNETVPSTQKKYFPGVDGIINLYDGFYIPGTLDEMEVSLHYNSSSNLTLRIGSDLLYQDNSGGVDTTVTIPDSNLSSVLDYNALSNTTTPLRLGLTNVSFVVNVSVDADTISVTDLSGSMGGSGGGCVPLYCGFDCGTCTAPGCKICDAKSANYAFIDAVLNKSGNRVGLVGYSTNAPAYNAHDLSTDDASLKTMVNNWFPIGTTCICCGINRAINMLDAQSDENKSKSIVVMTDGIANVNCNSFGDEDGDGDVDYDDRLVAAAQNAIDAACDAHINHNITVYAIGFGTDVDTDSIEQIGSCGGGGAFYGNVSQLVGIYQNISSQIIQASYYEQTIFGEGIYSRLYPDSYLLLNYTKTTPPYGLIVTSETDIFNNSESQGSFTIPIDSIPYEVRAISYSGSRWTSRVDAYNNSTGTWDAVYNLNDFGLNYTSLGDPYAVNIPLSKIVYGNNSVRVREGLGPSTSQAGSVYNKVIYSTIKNVSSFTPVVPVAEGCQWLIEEDGGASVVNVPSDYIGLNTCIYSSGNVSAGWPPEGIIFNENDAIQYATKLLLDEMDVDGDGIIDTPFFSEDVILEQSVIEGIPFTWDTEVQARVWR